MITASSATVLTTMLGLQAVLVSAFQQSESSCGLAGHWPYLLWLGHEVDGGVVVVVLLEQTERKLVVDQQVVCGDFEKRKKKKVNTAIYMNNKSYICNSFAFRLPR